VILTRYDLGCLAGSAVAASLPQAVDLARGIAARNTFLSKIA
jgi:hypothetical protein